MHKIKEIERNGIRFYVFIENEVNQPKEIMINNEDCCEFEYSGYDGWAGVDVSVVKKGICMVKELTEDIDNDIEILVNKWFDYVNTYKEIGVNLIF